MLVLHATWTDRALHLWGETWQGADRADQTASTPTDPGDAPQPHPFAASTDSIIEALERLELPLGDDTPVATAMTLFLPHRTIDGTLHPAPSARLEATDVYISSHVTQGVESDAVSESEIFDGEAGGELNEALATDDVAVAVVDEESLHLARTRVPAVRIEAEPALRVLLALAYADAVDGVALGHDLRFWTGVARVLADLLADQRFVPTMVRERDGSLDAAWLPWIADKETSERAATLLSAMPPAARAVDDEAQGDAWTVLDDAMRAMADAHVRRILVADDYPDAIDGRDPVEDHHVAWLAGLLDGSTRVPVDEATEMPLLRSARQWIGNLEEIGAGRSASLCLQLVEPSTELDDASATKAKWHLSFHLLTNDVPPVVVDAVRIWEPDSASEGLLASLGDEGESAADVLLAELARAARLWPKLEAALNENAPCGVDVSIDEAYEFLRDVRPLLAESGVEVLIPSWWGQSGSRIGARLFIDSEPLDAGGGGQWSSGAARPGDLGLHTLVDYSWQIALGDQPVTLDEFRALAAGGAPLVRVNGKWIEVRKEDLDGAKAFLEEHPGGRMTVLEAMRLANGIDGGDSALPILGLESTGWVSEVFGDHDQETFAKLEQPKSFRGELRPYQLAGLSWLAFLDRFGLGACLADDMGLGKTIQFIALMQHEQESRQRDVDAGNDPPPIGPALLVTPMSVLGNWRREFERFAPEMRVHVQHGLDRPIGDDFVDTAARHDVILTTYSLVTRDQESLRRVEWRRVALDEAQHIKNPPTKQTAAIRSLGARHRVALTGTPVENRLSELWSIMEFCTPGYLGSAAEFRKRFAVPIERHRDQRQAIRLRSLVQPFILRRLKTDPNVISDLPPLVQSRQTVSLTPEQARLYDAVVEDMLRRVDAAEGIRRRGLVLASLVKLKQICNHPAHFIGADEERGDAGPLVATRSGKSDRLIELLEEVLAAGDRALIFTQYRQMGHLLVSMIRSELDVDSLFLHGGTPQAKREQLVERFQSEDPAARVFVLSLKAGGVGLNLTAANHVFHFDRWWNPAVENQATDRAFRIGQTRTVHVHKMLSAGTLEERIDQMIEQKTELAERIIGAGESWLTELSTGQLRELLSLRHTALEDAD